MVVESWLPRTHTYGAPRSATGSRKPFSAAVPWSIVSPESTITLMSYCFTSEAMIFQLAGLRWMSETCSTRIVLGSGWYAGSVDVTSYSFVTFVTRRASSFW